MSKKEHYQYNDLVDTLTEDMTPVKALKVKRMLADFFSYRALITIGAGVLTVAILALITGGIIWITEYLQPPDNPMDWDQFAFLWLGLGAGVSMGWMLALDDILGRIRRRVVKIVDDAIEGDNS